ncbi:hypothetical protein J6590_044792 [Homalodisca vitripennis]|nr:hypothetical protein J6590_044792 [Homalodisca vitripennis]
MYKNIHQNIVASIAPCCMPSTGRALSTVTVSMTGASQDNEWEGNVPGVTLRTAARLLCHRSSRANWRWPGTGVTLSPLNVLQLPSAEYRWLCSKKKFSIGQRHEETAMVQSVSGQFRPEHPRLLPPVLVPEVRKRCIYSTRIYSVSVYLRVNVRNVFCPCVSKPSGFGRSSPASCGHPSPPPSGPIVRLLTESLLKRSKIPGIGHIQENVQPSSLDLLPSPVKPFWWGYFTRDPFDPATPRCCHVLTTGRLIALSCLSLVTRLVRALVASTLSQYKTVSTCSSYQTEVGLLTCIAPVGVKCSCKIEKIMLFHPSPFDPETLPAAMYLQSVLI